MKKVYTINSKYTCTHPALTFPKKGWEKEKASIILIEPSCKPLFVKPSNALLPRAYNCHIKRHKAVQQPYIMVYDNGIMRADNGSLHFRKHAGHTRHIHVVLVHPYRIDVT
jgi:hypothetical protein